MEKMRKAISKKVREQVFNKYNGHCAYCGCELKYKDMQIDHINSVYRAEIHGNKVDDSLDNYMPACRSCNFYKSTYTIEQFRFQIKQTLEKTCVQSFQAKLAMKYGIVKVTPWNEKFYFETIE